MRHVGTDWQTVVQQEVYAPLEASFPDRPRSLSEVFLQAQDAFADRTAIVFDGDEITFKEIASQVNKVAHALRYRYGVEPGDRIAILLATEPAFAVFVWAAISIGAVACPMNIRFQQAELKYQLSHAEPRILVGDHTVLQHVLPVRSALPSIEQMFTTDGHATDDALPISELIAGPEADPNPYRFVEETDPAFIFYTSGTTGHPKGVVTSQRALTYSILRSRLQTPETGASEVLCIPIPLHYTGGCKSFLSAFARGSKCVLLRNWKVDDLLQTVQKHRVTNLFALGSIWSLITASPQLPNYDLSSIQTVLFGGSATPAAMIERVSAVVPQARIIQGYGMTECNSGTVEEDARLRPASSGLPNPTTQLRVVDKDGSDLAALAVGEVLMRNAQIFSGYWRDPQATAQAMRGGWYHTGDLGYLDESGRLHVVGRVKDIIIRGQENIYPAEIESVIMQHAAVREVAVVGVPDEIFGEQVKALVVPEDGQSIRHEDIVDLCRRHLAEFKVPRFVEFREQPLPRNPGGKIMKRDLS